MLPHKPHRHEQANCAIMFGFRGSYDFLHNSFMKAGGGGSVALCLLFYSALNMSQPALAHRAPTCHSHWQQVPAGAAQARERRQWLRRQDVTGAVL